MKKNKKGVPVQKCFYCDKNVEVDMEYEKVSCEKCKEFIKTTNKDEN